MLALLLLFHWLWADIGWKKCQRICLLFSLLSSSQLFFFTFSLREISAEANINQAAVSIISCVHNACNHNLSENSSLDTAVRALCTHIYRHTLGQRYQARQKSFKCNHSFTEALTYIYSFQFQLVINFTFQSDISLRTLLNCRYATFSESHILQLDRTRSALKVELENFPNFVTVT